MVTFLVWTFFLSSCLFFKILLCRMVIYDDDLYGSNEKKLCAFNEASRSITSMKYIMCPLLFLCYCAITFVYRHMVTKASVFVLNYVCWENLWSNCAAVLEIFFRFFCFDSQVAYRHVPAKLPCLHGLLLTAAPWNRCIQHVCIKDAPNEKYDWSCK